MKVKNYFLAFQDNKNNFRIHPNNPYFADKLTNQKP